MYQVEMKFPGSKPGPAIKKVYTRESLEKLRELKGLLLMFPAPKSAIVTKVGNTEIIEEWL